MLDTIIIFVKDLQSGNQDIKSSDVIAFASFFIAALAMVATAIQAFSSKKHNKLSVKPYLTLSSIVSPNEPHFTLYVSNRGLGPAIISKFHLTYDGIEISSASGSFKQSNMQSLVDKFFQHSSQDIPYSISPSKPLINTLQEGDVLSPGDDHKMISLGLAGVTILDVDKLINNRDKFKLRIDYTSLYNEPDHLNAIGVKISDRG